MPGFVWLEGAWCYTDDITPVARFSRTRATHWRRAASAFQSMAEGAGDLDKLLVISDPDHWAWEGWMLRMLGNERWRLHLDDVGEWSFWVNGPPETHGTGHLIHVGESLGRAAIAASAALGRWPGGEG